jgi:hypothetical protein
MWLEAHFCGEWEIEGAEVYSSPAGDDPSAALAFADDRWRPARV